MTTDTSERGLERLICTAPAGHPGERDPRIGTVMKVLGTRGVRLTFGRIQGRRQPAPRGTVRPGQSQG